MPLVILYTDILFGAPKAYPRFSLENFLVVSFVYPRSARISLKAKGTVGWCQMFKTWPGCPRCLRLGRSPALDLVCSDT